MKSKKNSMLSEVFKNLDDGRTQVPETQVPESQVPDSQVPESQVPEASRDTRHRAATESVSQSILAPTHSTPLRSRRLSFDSGAQRESKNYK